MTITFNRRKNNDDSVVKVFGCVFCLFVCFLKESCMRVTLVTNDGSGMPQALNVRNGITVGSFLDTNFTGNVDDFDIKVRSSDGHSEVVDCDYVLEDGDRISLTPTKVEGAVIL